MKKISKTIILALFCCSIANAQSISYNEYIKNVAEKNAAYLAEKYNVDIAEANLSAARVFNDPELSVDYGNNQDWYMEMGQSLEFGLSYDLDLAGNRRARIRSAKNEKEITEASVNAYLCNLRAEASQAWAKPGNCARQASCSKVLQKIWNRLPKAIVFVFPSVM